jgi:hypothetical protein
VRRETAADWSSPPVRRRGRASAAPLGWTGPVWAESVFLFFQGISNCFSILFSLVFSIQIQTCATIQRIFKLSMMQHFMMFCQK